MKLLTELNEDVQILTEGTGPGKQMFVEGIMMQFNHLNKNKRQYPTGLKSEVYRFIKEYVDQNRAYGELDHPTGPKVNLKNASHRIISLQENGNNFVGKAQISSTPCGAIARGLIEDGGKLGVSSRAMGSLKQKNGYMEVQEDFMISTVDLVADPSAHDAFVNALFESKEWAFENGIWKESDLVESRNILKNTSSRSFEQVAIREFSKFLNKLR